MLKKLLQFFYQEGHNRKEEERIALTEAVRTQFLKLKEKGLSIPVFTL